MRVGQKIGRFEVDRELAVGGMGAIYIAHDADSGARVALKTVTTSSSGHVISLRREIRALLSIEHPALVEIVDHGLYDEVPWFAMEFIEGASLRAHFGAAYETELVDVESAATLPVHETPTSEYATVEPWPMRKPAPREQRELLMHMAAICRGVGHMHGHGLVHRDLKPENIIIRESDGRPILVDFGIASRSAGGSREHATQVGLVAGTPAYMSPEQARNQWVDARSDIYAVGCILYEIATGRPPFTTGSPFELISKHAFTEPTPLPDDVDERLARLIMNLLQKSPEDRIGYADLVARELEEILEIEPPDDFPEVPVYVYRPRFVGRDDEMSACAERLADLADGRGSTTAIIGAPGSGKTRFALELKRRVDADARIEGLLVEVGVDRTGPADLPFRATVAEIADRCREQGSQYTRRVLGEDGAALALLYPQLLNLPGMETFETPRPLPPALEIARRIHAWTSILMRLSSGRPLVFIVDQIGPRLIKYVVALKKVIRQEELPLAVFVTSGGSDEDFRQLEKSDVVELGPLGTDALEVVVRTMLAIDETPAALNEFVVERSRGLPAIVAEYLTLATERGLVSRDDDGTWLVDADADDWSALPLPDRLGGLVIEKIGGLPGRSQRLVRLIAVYGTKISIGALANLVDSPRDLEGLDSLLKSGILVSRSDAIAFAENNVRDAVLDLIPNSEIEAAHLKVAEAMLESDDPDVRFEAARHLSRAGELERARTEILEIVRPFRTTDQVRAYRYLSLFFELDPPESRQTLLAIMDFCRAANITGRLNRTVEQAKFGMRMAERLEEYVDYYTLATGMAFGMASRGEVDEARALIQDERLEKLDDPYVKALANYSLGTIEMVERNWEKALAHYNASAAELIANAENPRSPAALHINMTNCLGHLGRFEEALTCLEKTAELTQQAGATDLEAYVYGNRAALLFKYRYHVEGALPLVNRAIALHDQVHDRAGVAHARTLRSKILAHLSRYEEAREDVRSAMSVFEMADARVEVTRSHATYALYSAALGEHEEAEAVLEKLVSTELPNSDARLYVVGIMARIARREGRYEEARRLLDSIRDLLDQTNDPDLFFCRAEEAFLEVTEGRKPASLKEPEGDVPIQIRTEIDALAEVLAGAPTIHGEPRERYEREWPGHSSA